MFGLETPRTVGLWSSWVMWRDTGHSRLEEVGTQAAPLDPFASSSPAQTRTNGVATVHYLTPGLRWSPSGVYEARCHTHTILLLYMTKDSNNNIRSVAFLPIYVLASIATLLMRLQPTRVNYNVVIKGKLRSIEDRRKYTKHSNSFSNSVVVIQVHFPKEDRRLPSSLYYCYLGVCFSNNLWHVRLMWLVILRFWQQNRQTSTWVILEFFSRL